MWVSTSKRHSAELSADETPLPAAEVELVVHRGGHTVGPPGTTDIVWTFFERHPMPE